MQDLTTVRSLLASVGARPTKALGQCFLVDLNKMAQVVELADVQPGRTILEVGPGTGSLTEELLARAGRVVADELDRTLAGLLRTRFAEPVADGRLTLIEGDVLAGKHEIAPAVLDAVGPEADLVANLPYQVATPLVANLMIESWRSLCPNPPPAPHRFGALTFTVQKEVADRLAATGGPHFGTVSVLLQLLGRVRLGPVIPAGAFWPAPQIASQLVRVDFDEVLARQVRDVATLQRLLQMAFTQRRKQIGSTVRSRSAPFGREAFGAACDAVGVDPTTRADALSVEQFGRLANVLVDPHLR